MALMTGLSAGQILADALGLRGQPVRKIVLVADVNAAVQVFVQRFVHDDEFDAIRDTLAPLGVPVIHSVAGVEVDEQGRVFVPARDHATLREAARRLLVEMDDHERWLGVPVRGELRARIEALRAATGEGQP